MQIRVFVDLISVFYGGFLLNFWVRMFGGLGGWYSFLSWLWWKVLRFWNNFIFSQVHKVRYFCATPFWIYVFLIIFPRRLIFSLVRLKGILFVSRWVATFDPNVGIRGLSTLFMFEGAAEAASLISPGSCLKGTSGLSTALAKYPRECNIVKGLNLF